MLNDARASPTHTLRPREREKGSQWVIINAAWYKVLIEIEHVAMTIEAQTISQSLNSAEQLLSAGRGEEAETAYGEILTREPGNPIAVFQLAVIANARGDHRGAADRFDQAARLMPATAATHHNLGVALRQLNRHSQAIDPLRRALVLQPAGVGACSSLAQSLEKTGEHDAAVALARRQTLLDPSSSKAFANLGYVTWRAGDLELAGDALRRALELDPSETAARVNLANVQKASGDEAGALALYRKIADEQPTNPGVWYNLGVALIDADLLEEAAEAYRRHARLLHGRPLNMAPDLDPFPDLPIDPVKPISRLTCWHRLVHDRDQLAHLRDQGLLPPSLVGQIAAYQSILDEMSEDERQAISFTLSEDRYRRIQPSYGRLVRLEPSGWRNEPALSGTLDWHAMEGNYLSAEPKAVTIDGLLRPEARTALLRHCHNSTYWFEIKGAGYLGAYLREGFSDPLILRIATELRQRLPRILGSLPLKMTWAYSYEQSMVGINPHADFAAVNVNFWITDDEANADPDTGGLVVFKKPAPKDWSFERYNTASISSIYEFLGADRDDFLRVPHRANRALLFDSRLLHETDQMNFKPGFTNRRINITMLFGEGG